MATWKKKNVAKEIVQQISKNYNCDLMTASILARKGITEGKDILFYLENDQRFMHNPFLFSTMEDQKESPKKIIFYNFLLCYLNCKFIIIFIFIIKYILNIYFNIDLC